MPKQELAVEAPSLFKVALLGLSPHYSLMLGLGFRDVALLQKDCNTAYTAFQQEPALTKQGVCNGTSTINTKYYFAHLGRSRISLGPRLDNHTRLDSQLGWHRRRNLHCSCITALAIWQKQCMGC